MSRPPLAAVPLALLVAAGACNRPMASVAGTPEPIDYSELPGKPDWNDLPDPLEILKTTEYQPPTLPCRACHDQRETNPTPRPLVQMHSDIVFHHDEEHRWCLGCHAPEPRDKLRLADGKLIDFREHFLLCGQCHGPTYKDWRAGIHGKRTGMWNGEKRWWTCVECHDPHHPYFGTLEPKPPPPREVPGYVPTSYPSER